MMNTTVKREESLFLAALELTNAGERRLFLDQACAGDPEMLAGVEALLAAQGESDLFFAESMSSLEPSSGDPESADRARTRGDALFAKVTAAEIPGTRIGRYRIREQLGEGGGGVVYIADQEEPVRRLVALKVIKLGMDTKSVIARFEAERQALAMMDHPNIARVFDAGAMESGRPYFVMELVRGVKITEYCDKHQLDTSERLALFIQICGAVQHAHQKGIIHRDLKPSNILVTRPDAGGPGMPKVIDFGIAKATGVQLTDKTLLTAHEHPLGTPAYMSPEQIEMEGVDIDTRSDIYSLGVVLYELLAGRPPFDSKELLRFGLFGMRHTLRETEPQRPSTMITTLQCGELAKTAEHRRTDPPKLISQVRGDLDWIVMKALEKDRARRYDTVTGLAMDIQRHLNNEPVSARPPSRLYQFQKLVRRNRVVFAAAGAVTAALVIGLGTSTWLFLQEREALGREAVLRRQAEAREKITQVLVLVGNKKFEEAEALLGRISAPAEPSLEAAKVFRSLGEWHALLGQWNQAAGDFTKLLQVNDADKSDKSENATGDLLRAGPALAQLGDQADYEHFRRAAIARFTGTMNPVAAEQVIKTSLLLPADEQVLKSLDPFADLAAKSVAKVGRDGAGGTFLIAWRWVCLAMMEYRRGNWAKAAECSRTSMEFADNSPVQTATARIILAMACHQLHQDDEARSELVRGGEVIESRFATPLNIGNDAQGQWFDWLIARIYLREAMALVGGNTGPNH